MNIRITSNVRQPDTVRTKRSRPFDSLRSDVSSTVVVPKRKILPPPLPPSLPTSFPPWLVNHNPVGMSNAPVLAPEQRPSTPPVYNPSELPEHWIAVPTKDNLHYYNIADGKYAKTIKAAWKEDAKGPSGKFADVRVAKEIGLLAIGREKSVRAVQPAVGERNLNEIVYGVEEEGDEVVLENIAQYLVSNGHTIDNLTKLIYEEFDRFATEVDISEVEEELKEFRKAIRPIRRRR